MHRWQHICGTSNRCLNVLPNKTLVQKQHIRESHIKQWSWPCTHYFCHLNVIPPNWSAHALNRILHIIKIQLHDRLIEIIFKFSNCSTSYTRKSVMSSCAKDCFLGGYCPTSTRSIPIYLYWGPKEQLYSASIMLVYYNCFKEGSKLAGSVMHQAANGH